MFKIFLLLILTLSAFSQQSSPSTYSSSGSGSGSSYSGSSYSSSTTFDYKNFNLNLFNWVGDWYIWDSDCTDISGCIPTITVTSYTGSSNQNSNSYGYSSSSSSSSSNNNNQIQIKYFFPNIPTCTKFQNITVIEILVFGKFTDTNPSSPLYGATGYLRPNNGTIQILRPNFPSSGSYGSSSSGSYGSSSSSSSSSYGSGSSGSSYGSSSSSSRCYDIWGNSQSTYTNRSTTYTNSYYSDEYYVYNMLPLDSTTTCCYPDAPILFKVNDDSVYWAGRLADCEACKTLKGQVVLKGPLYGNYGGFYDSDDEKYFYQMDSKTLISVDHLCAALWVEVPRISSCQSTSYTYSSTSYGSGSSGSSYGSGSSGTSYGSGSSSSPSYGSGSSSSPSYGSGSSSSPSYGSGSGTGSSYGSGSGSGTGSSYGSGSGSSP